MRSKWLDWQPSAGGFVGFDGSPSGVFPIIQPAGEGEEPPAPPRHDHAIEKATGNEPTKPTKPLPILSFDTCGQIPAMPEGVRLLEWNLKPAPIILTYFSVVTDVERFVAATLAELKAAMNGQEWQAGHWSVRDLVDRLEQCGVRVEIIP
jgi:hypothetical protein